MCIMNLKLNYSPMKFTHENINLFLCTCDFHEYAYIMSLSCYHFYCSWQRNFQMAVIAVLHTAVHKIYQEYVIILSFLNEHNGVFKLKTSTWYAWLKVGDAINFYIVDSLDQSYSMLIIVLNILALLFQYNYLEIFFTVSLSPLLLWSYTISMLLSSLTF